MQPKIENFNLRIIVPTKEISTYAPARGATSPLFHDYQTTIISTHAPARGATEMFAPSPMRNENFNSRARAGRDPPVQTIEN